MRQGRCANTDPDLARPTPKGHRERTTRSGQNVSRNGGRRHGGHHRHRPHRRSDGGLLTQAGPVTITRVDGTVTTAPAYQERELRALVRVRGDVTPEKREYVMRRDRGTCRYCGADATEVDHVVPVALGGSGAVRNLVAACGDCNSRKGATVWKPKPLHVVLRMRRT